MSPDRIRQILSAQPFEPFTIFTGDGSTVDVLSREFAWLRPPGKTLVVTVPLIDHATEEREFEEHNIDVFLITKVSSPPRRKRRNGRRRAG
jgi:hypothetical protein